MKHHRHQHCAKQGCMYDKLAKVYNKHTAEVDQMWEEYQNEHLSLITILEVELIPYLEKYAVAGDEDARDLMITLRDFL